MSRFAGLPLLFLLATALAGRAAVIDWSASSGVEPESVGYTLFDTATPEDPSLAASTLTLSTDSAAEVMQYRLNEGDLAFGGSTTVEFRMRMISSSADSAIRRGAYVGVVASENVFISLWIGIDDLRFTGGDDTVLASTGLVDTDGAFHDYRLEIDGTNAGGTVLLFQDEVEVLSATLTETTLPGLMGAPAIGFGDGTSLESGTSEWQSFSHNAGIPEPSSGLLALLGAGVGLIRYRVRPEGRSADYEIGRPM